MQLCCFAFEFGIARMKRAEVRQGERMLFDGDVVQPRTAIRIPAPGAPGDQEIEAEAEPGLEDDEALAPGPARGQGAAVQENVLGLRRPAGGAVIDVALRLGKGGAFLERQSRRDERLGHGPSIEFAA
jgi:hypothetical protein